MSLFDEIMAQYSNGKRRILVYVMTLLTITTILATLYFLNTSEYKTIVSDLNANEMQVMTAELDRVGAHYKANDHEVMVKADEFDAARAQLAGNKLFLDENVGFEIFDKSELGITEFAQHINYQRAMQGELGRTIAAINGVKYARIHLVMPEPGIFQQETKKPSASVTLFLDDGFNLSERQISGIQQLVSSSVEGLEFENVMIINNHGVILNSHEASKSNDINDVTTQLVKKIEIEKYLENKAIKALSMAIGDGCCIASIDVEMDFRSITKTRDEILPQETLRTGILKERIQKPTSNDKHEPKPVTTDVEYKLGRQVAQITEVPGSIRRIGVGIVVPDFVTLESQKKIQMLMSAVLGLDNGRGDTISVIGPVINTANTMNYPDMEDSKAHIHKATITGESVNSKSTTTDNPSAGRNVTNSDVIENAKPVKQHDLTIITELKGLTKLSIAQLVAIFLVVLLITMGIILATYKVYRNKHAMRNKLSNSERERILQQITDWLNLDTNSTSIQGISQ